MIGRTNNQTPFEQLFEKQRLNQQAILQKGLYEGFGLPRDADLALPMDEPRLCSYHVQQLVSEIGEVLEADKRWKNFRNERYSKPAKVEEIADCFIVLMNMAMFSGISGDEMAKAIDEKLDVVSRRVAAQKDE